LIIPGHSPLLNRFGLMNSYRLSQLCFFWVVTLTHYNNTGTDSHMKNVMQK